MFLEINEEIVRGRDFRLYRIYYRRILTAFLLLIKYIAFGLRKSNQGKSAGLLEESLKKYICIFLCL